MNSGLFDYSYDKIIIYVRTYKDADNLAGLLHYSSYIAESRTLIEKKQILDR